MPNRMTKSQLTARKIVEALAKATQPGKCSWGDSHPQAHAELFTQYQKDLALTVEKTLKSPSWVLH